MVLKRILLLYFVATIKARSLQARSIGLKEVIPEVRTEESQVLSRVKRFPTIGFLTFAFSVINTFVLIIQNVLVNNNNNNNNNNSNNNNNGNSNMNMNGRRLFRMLNTLIMNGSEMLFPGSTVQAKDNESTALVELVTTNQTERTVQRASTTESPSSSPVKTVNLSFVKDKAAVEDMVKSLIDGDLSTNQVPPGMRWDVLQLLNKRMKEQ